MKDGSAEAFRWAARHMRRGSISAKDTEAFLDAANILEQQAEHLDVSAELFYFRGHAALEAK